MKRSKGTLFVLLALVVAMLCVGVYNTITAYMSDGGRLVNTFVIGGNQVEILEDFIPPEKLTPGTSFKKEVKVSNVGVNECFIRVMVQFTNSDMGQYCTVDWNTDDWVFNEEDSYWYYKHPVANGNETTSLFTRITLSNDIPEAIIKDFDVIVYTESYQSGDLESYEEAWAIYHANKKDVIGPGLFVYNLSGVSEDAPTYVNTNNLLLSGTIYDSSKITSLTVNGNAVEVLGTSTSWEYLLTANDSGITEVTITALDEYGNSTSLTRYVGVDSDVPALFIQGEEGNSESNPVIYGGPLYTVSGTASDSLSGLKSVTVNGNAVIIEDAGSWSSPISLEEGVTSAVSVVAKDEAGNAATKVLYVKYENLVADAQENITLMPATNWVHTLGTAESIQVPAEGSPYSVFDVVVFVDSYTSTSEELARWPAAHDSDGDGSLNPSVMCYAVNNLPEYPDKLCLLVAGNGAGKIYANSDFTEGFAGFSNVTEFVNIGLLDVSNVEIADKMFYGCSSVTSFELGSFDTSSVTTMASMFEGCSSLESVDVSGFSTSDVADISYLFASCSRLKTVDVTGWDVSNVTSMDGLFKGCTALEATKGISAWVTSSLETAISLFEGCVSVEGVDLSGWSTPKLVYMENIFAGCSGLKGIDLSGWDVSNVQSFAGAFVGCDDVTTAYARTEEDMNILNAVSDKPTSLVFTLKIEN
jgi:surface protein